MYLIAALAYAFSIFIDISVYYIKYYIQDNKNIRYILSLINIFQYSARAFVLIFVPVMSYLTETVKDKNKVWEITLITHVFVVLFLLLLFHTNFILNFSKFIIKILNIIFGKSKKIEIIHFKPVEKNNSIFKSSTLLFFSVSYLAGFLFSFSISFLYIFSFYFPSKALMLSSFAQIINMFGSLLLILFIDPKIMSLIDKEEGLFEIKVFTISRILVHITLVIILFLIK
jgi:hypothetical protein